MGEREFFQGKAREADERAARAKPDSVECKTWTDIAAEYRRFAACVGEDKTPFWPVRGKH